MVARVMFSSQILFVIQRIWNICTSELGISSKSRLETHTSILKTFDGIHRHGVVSQIISAQQLPRLRDSDGREIIEKSIVDPFVEVSLHIPEWSVSPFLSDGATTGSAKPPTATSSTSTVSARTVSFRTAVVKDNGFNPIWRKEICIPFDCVGDMKDLIFVGIAVHQENKGLIGVHCTSLGCLEQGRFLILPLKFHLTKQFVFSQGIVICPCTTPSYPSCYSPRCS